MKRRRARRDAAGDVELRIRLAAIFGRIYRRIVLGLPRVGIITSLSKTFLVDPTESPEQSPGSTGVLVFSRGLLVMP